MKVAVASNNGETVGQHFGRVRQFVVVTVEDGVVTGREIRDNPNARSVRSPSSLPSPSSPASGREGRGRGSGGGRGRGRGQGGGFGEVDALEDCVAIIAGGMGEGAYGNLQRLGIEPVLTDARRVEEAALRYAAGDLPNLEERIHTGGDHDHDHD